MTKTGLSYFLTGDAKNVHCAICAFWQYAGFSQIRSQMASEVVPLGFTCRLPPHDLTYAHNFVHAYMRIQKKHQILKNRWFSNIISIKVKGKKLELLVQLVINGRILLSWFVSMPTKQP